MKALPTEALKSVPALYLHGFFFLACVCVFSSRVLWCSSGGLPRTERDNGQYCWRVRGTPGQQLEKEVCYSKLTSSYEKQHVTFVFLDLGHFTQDECFHLPVNFLISVFDSRMIFHYVNVPCFHYPLISDGHLGWFHFLAVVKREAMHMDDQIFL